MTNGYIVLTKGDSKLYQHAIEAINLGKPIYFVDAENKAIYFGNKIALDDSNVVINAGNDTITIASDNTATVTTSEVIANPELAGTEANLTGLQVGDTKYAMPFVYLDLLALTNLDATAYGLADLSSEFSTTDIDNIQASDSNALTETQFNNIKNIIDSALTNHKAIYTQFEGYDSIIFNGFLAEYRESGDYSYEISYFDIADNKHNTIAIGKNTNNIYFIAIV